VVFTLNSERPKNAKYHDGEKLRPAKHRSGNCCNDQNVLQPDGAEIRTALVKKNIYLLPGKYLG
jgi:hypothetical protein